MSPILPNKTEFIPQAPANEHEIFMAMRTYPDNVKVYHPHGRIDATSVFWHNKLHPTTQNFAVYVDPKATEQTVLFPRILGDIEKLAWKFSNNQMITCDYVPQHPFNQWLQTKRFRLVDTVLTAELATNQLNLKQTVQLNKNRILSFSQLMAQPTLLKRVLKQSLNDYRGQQRYDPAIAIPLADWQALISDKVVLDAPSVLLDDGGKPAAYSLLSGTSENIRLGLMSGNTAKGLNQLLNTQLAWIKNNSKNLSGYFHTNRQLDMKIIKSLPFNIENRYETLKRLS